MPDEIIIADDGSTSDTAELIKSIAATAKVPIIHVWHEDNGLKLCQIRNKAFARCSDKIFKGIRDGFSFNPKIDYIA